MIKTSFDAPGRTGGSARVDLLSILLKEVSYKRNLEGKNGIVIFTGGDATSKSQKNNKTFVF